MPDVKQLTPKELKEITDYLKKKSVDLQVRVSSQKIRRMEDGGLVIDPPAFSTAIVRISPSSPKPSNGQPKLETQ